MEKSLVLLDQVRMAAITQAMNFGPRLLVAGAILVFGFYVGRWAGRVFRRSIVRLHLEPDLEELLERVLRIAVLALFGVIALQNLGVELLPLIAGLGVAGAGVALAMQGLLSNLVAGLTIIFSHPFRIGEYISIVGVEGQVAEISLFNTVLTHADNSRVVIPNRKLVGEILHNYGHIRQLELGAMVAYDADLGLALGAIQDVLQGNSRVLTEPAPLVQVASLEASGVSIAIRPWVGVSDNPQAVGELNQALLEAFHRHNIRVPVPQRDVRLIPVS